MNTTVNRNSAGRVLGNRYTLLAPIAQGGMGEVWKARDQESGHMVAAKVLRPELSGEELSLSRLRLEARNAMRIQHPNIASVLDSGEDGGRGWIIMELVDGRPLTDYLRGGTRMSVEDLIPVLVQVAMALQAASSAGVIHRDIKPANVLVRSDGMVKLTDFGISRTTDQATLTAAGMVMGTAQYLPPEQAMGARATAPGDLYALGVIAYECVAGRRPFTGTTQVDIAFSHVNDAVPALPPDVPVPFANVVLHLLEKDPAKRPESGASLVRELMRAARTLDIPITPRPLPLPEGEALSEPTTDHPIIAPVAHTPRRVLPPELVNPPDLGEVGTLPSLPPSFTPTAARPRPEGSGERGAREGGTRGPSTGDRSDPGRTEATGAARTVRGVGASAGGAGSVGAAEARHAQAASDAASHPTTATSPASPPSDRGRAELSRRLRERASRRAAEDVRQSPKATPPVTATPEPLPNTPARPLQAPAATSSSVAPAAQAPRRHRARPSQEDSSRIPQPTPQARPRQEEQAPVHRHSRSSHHTTRTLTVPSRDTRTPRSTAARWHTVSPESATVIQRARPIRTTYNRSVVAPPIPLRTRIGRWLVIALIIIAILLIAIATIHNRFGSLSSIVGAGTQVTEEAPTWSIPWTTV